MSDRLRLLAPARIVSALLAASLPAQRQFGVDARQTLPVDLPGLMFAVLADVDGDHDPDLCGLTADPASAAQPQFRLTVTRNDGHGNFAGIESYALFPTNVNTPTSLVAVDVDGDQDLDFIVGRSFPLPTDMQTLLLRNDGAGHFTLSPGLPVDASLGCAGLAAFDCDGDHDVDLFLSTPNNLLGAQPDRLLINDGSGVFTPSTRSLPQDGVLSTSPIAADVDRDGDLDLCFLRAMRVFPLTGGSTLYLNDGLGGFTDATATHLPQNFGIGGLGLVLFDADGDQDLDLAVYSPDSGLTTADRLVLNDGTGHFPSVPINYFPNPPVKGTMRLIPLDVDGDSDLDLFVARVQQASSESRLADRDALWRNDGTGHFTDATSTFLPLLSTSALEAIADDLDGDGDIDILIREAGRMQYLRNEAGTFVDDLRYRIPSDVIGAASFEFADVDRDGIPDLLATRAADSALIFARNDGDGRFLKSSQRPVVSNRFVAFDADGDGATDVLELIDGQDILLRGDGDGGFNDVTIQSLPIETGDTIAAIAFDEDGDGDLDLWRSDEVSPSFVPTHSLWRNDGHGHFTAVPGVIPAVDAVPALAVDVDGDGDLDMLMASPRLWMSIYQPHLLLNEGGVFVDAGTARFPAVNESIQYFVAGDVDRDGDIDVVLGAAEPPGPGFGQNHLYLNMGGATFVDATAGHLPTKLTKTLGLALFDVDDDGDLDLVETDSSGDPDVVLNDGHGVFQSVGAARIDFPTSLRGRLRTADIDGDGDIDLLAEPPALRIDRARQLEAPFAARLGGTFTLRGWIEPGYGDAHSDLWVWYALDRLPSPIALPPFGTLHLDPFTLIYERRLTTTAGFVDHVVQVPNLAALVGVRLQIQAAHVQQVGPRFGNLLDERIGR